MRTEEDAALAQEQMAEKVKGNVDCRQRERRPLLVFVRLDSLSHPVTSAQRHQCSDHQHDHSRPSPAQPHFPADAQFAKPLIT